LLANPIHHAFSRIGTSPLPILFVDEPSKLREQLNLLDFFESRWIEWSGKDILQPVGSIFDRLSLRKPEVGNFSGRLRTNLHRDLFNVVGFEEVVLEDCWKVAVKLLEHVIPVLKISGGNYCRCNHIVALIQDQKKSIQGLNVLLSVLPFQGVKEMVNCQTEKTSCWAATAS
jgi:hypothetical protein